MQNIMTMTSRYSACDFHSNSLQYSEIILSKLVTSKRYLFKISHNVYVERSPCFISYSDINNKMIIIGIKLYNNWFIKIKIKKKLNIIWNLEWW